MIGREKDRDDITACQIQFCHCSNLLGKYPKFEAADPQQQEENPSDRQKYKKNQQEGHGTVPENLLGELRPHGQECKYNYYCYNGSSGDVGPHHIS